MNLHKTHYRIVQTIWYWKTGNERILEEIARKILITCNHTHMIIYFIFNFTFMYDLKTCLQQTITNCDSDIANISPPPPFIFISWRLITLQYCSGFCHTLTWISHGFTCIPHPDPPSHLPVHLIPLGLPSAPSLSTCIMNPTWAGDMFHYR